MRRLLMAALPLCLAAADKPVPLLGPGDLDPALVLPLPPAAGSAQAKAELAELHAIEAVRTPAERAAAMQDGETKNATIFAAALGPRFVLHMLPETKALMALVRASEKATVDRGKAEFRRPRPYAVDATLASCKRSDDPLSSYPSGHTSMAYAMGETLARLVPTKAPTIMARAARYGESRIVCEQHYRSDVTAGALLGTLVAERLMGTRVFRSRFDAARNELARAGIK